MKGEKGREAYGRVSALGPHFYFAAFLVLWTGRVFLLPVDEALAHPWLKFVWVQGLRLGLWVLPVVAWLRWRERTPVLPALGLDVLPRGRALAVACGIIGACLSISAAYALATGISSVDRLFSHSAPEWAALLLLTPFAPIAEEILFRGFLLPWLARARSFAKANCVQALMFTVIHFPGWLYMRGLSQAVLHDAIGVFVIGLVLGYLFHQTKSLWPSIVLHTLNNLWMGSTG